MVVTDDKKFYTKRTLKETREGFIFLRSLFRLKIPPSTSLSCQSVTVHNKIDVDGTNRPSLKTLRCRKGSKARSVPAIANRLQSYPCVTLVPIIFFFND